MTKRPPRIIESHRLYSAAELHFHGFIHAALIVSGIAAGMGVTAMLYVWFGRFGSSPFFITPMGVITAVLVPGAHVWEVGVHIATEKRMARVSLISATWLALGIPSCLFVVLGGYPLFNYAVAVIAIFFASVIIAMLLWYGCVWLGGDILVVSGDRCFHCGYDLQGNESGVCPECGAAICSTAKGDTNY